MNKQRLIRAAAILALIMAPTVAMTDDAPALKEIMQELRNNLIEIADGILTDNFEQVAQGAASIAGHPQIAPAQVALVAAALGPEMPAFKRLDNVVHDLSLEISAAAEALDRDAVISGYQRIVEGCVDCHSTYKERVATALGAQPE